jgi:hypothetical protein
MLDCIRLGQPHAIARTFDEALMILRAWGCLREEIMDSAVAAREPRIANGDRLAADDKSDTLSRMR